MKQVLAVRVGAKKAVGHIVSKKWGPTVSDSQQGFSDRLSNGKKMLLHRKGSNCQPLTKTPACN